MFNYLKLKQKTMWKALIKLIESWSYRCDHDFELIKETQEFEYASSTHPSHSSSISKNGSMASRLSRSGAHSSGAKGTLHFLQVVFIFSF